MMAKAPAQRMPRTLFAALQRRYTNLLLARTPLPGWHGGWPPILTCAKPAGRHLLPQSAFFLDQIDANECE
jgi:hypothetical protein